MNNSNRWEKLLALDEFGDDEEDYAMNTESLLPTMLLFDELSRQRAIKWHNQRLNWSEHVQQEMHMGTFESKYHMPLPSFTKLVELLRPAITVFYSKSLRKHSNLSRAHCWSKFEIFRR